MAEERFTREEWQAITTKEACASQGHDYRIVVSMGINAPSAVVCNRCGLQWKVS